MSQDLALPEFDQLDELISDLVDDTSPSFIHGFFAGILAGGYALNKNDYMDPLLEQMVIQADQVSDTLQQLLTQLYDYTRNALTAPTFVFQLLLPQDDQSLQWRAEGLANWATGFINGFAETTQIKDTDLNEELREILTDMTSIADLDIEIDDSDDNENQLMELEEYLRATTQYMFDHMGQKPMKKTAVAESISTTLH